MYQQSKRQRIHSPQEQNSNPLKAYFSEGFLASTLFLIPPTPSLSVEDILGPFNTPHFSYPLTQQYFSLPQSQSNYAASTPLAPTITAEISTTSSNNQPLQPRVAEKRNRTELNEASGYEEQLKAAVKKDEQLWSKESIKNSAAYAAKERIQQKLPCPEDNSPEFVNAHPLYKETYINAYKRYADKREKLIEKKGASLGELHANENKPKLPMVKLLTFRRGPSFAKGYLHAYEKAMKEKQKVASFSEGQTPTSTMASSSQSEEQEHFLRTPEVGQIFAEVLAENHLTQSRNASPTLSFLNSPMQFFFPTTPMNSNVKPSEGREFARESKTP